MTVVAHSSGRVSTASASAKERVLVALFAATVLAAVCCGCGRTSDQSHRQVRGTLLVTLSEAAGVPGNIDDLGLSPLRLSPVSTSLLPSAASALTGLLPPEHGLRIDGVGSLHSSVDTVAEKFAARGYDCAAFLSDPALSRVHALDAGFSQYSSRMVATNATARFRVPSAEICAEASEWIASRKDPSKPVFVWVHLTPLGGSAPTWAAAGKSENSGSASASSLDGLAALISQFDSESPVLVAPLYVSSPDASGARSFDPPGDGAVPVSSTGYARFVRESPGGASVADIPWLLGLSDSMRPAYWESIVPWYAFRLPPLVIADPGAPNSRRGLSGPAIPVPLARQSEMAALRASGHLGEGLIPPLPDSVPLLGALSSDGEARIGRWRDALSATNRLEAARALVDSDPGVPLFHEMLGLELAAAGDLPGACNAYSEVSDLGYNMVSANRRLSRLHAALGNMASAIDRAEAAFMAWEDDPVPRHELAQLLLRAGSAMSESGELRSASDCIDRVLLLEPKNPAARFESARLRLRLGETNAAITILRRIVDDTPKFAPAVKLLQEIDRR